MSAYTFATWRLNSAQSLTIADAARSKVAAWRLALMRHVTIITWMAT